MMKLKRRLVLIILIFLAMFLLGFSNGVNAETGSKYLGIKILRESGFGYKALEKNVWKIVESNQSGSTFNYDSTIYCLKGGPGFGSGDFGSGDPIIREYTRYFDMKNPDSIPTEYKKSLPDVNSDTYKALLWLLENVYVSASSNASLDEKQDAKEYRDYLLEQAGLSGSQLTDDDIDVVQQLAIWHFTNNDVFDAGNEGNFELWINAVSGQDSNYNPLSDEKGEGGEYGWDRAEDAKTLYKYLIDTASEKAPDYIVKTASQTYEIANLTQTVEEKDSNYIIGPFKIDRISETEGTLEGKFSNSTGDLNPTLQDKNGTTFSNLEETIGKEFYIVLPQTTNIDTIIFSISGVYFNTKVEYWSVENAPAQDQPVAIVERVKKDYSDEVTFNKPEDKEFDLALRKFINSINGVEPSTSRVPKISDETLKDLADGRTTTAEKIHPKNPLAVKTGDSVIYTIRVYNEGDIDAIVTEITDYLPIGLKLKESSSINTNNGWTSADGKTVTTDKLNGQILKAFDGNTLSYLDVQVECEVTAKISEDDTELKNVAEITGATDSEGTEMTDRDSTPGNVDVPGYGEVSQEDDDDFEDLVILGQYFDLALRKYITSIDGKSVDRVPTVDRTSLTSGTTAVYNHIKNPLGVKVGDEIVYTIRVYNEGQLDGYATEITDYLPDGLEFVNDSFNTQKGWSVEGDGRTVKTTALSDELIKAYDGNNLDYAEVQIKCKVTTEVKPGDKLTNIAEITGFTDGNGDTIKDRDSQAGNITLPSDSTLPNYKDDEINRGDKYIPGQQDDDDFEKVVVDSFDLALRKFITGVNADSVTNRVPVFSNEDGKYIYTHTKEPVKVQTGDTVIYTLRIYNEGDIAGYAEEVKDDIPEGLEFLPESTTNINYRWVMYDGAGEVTEDPSQAVSIRTDYLSKAQADETGRNNLIEAFDSNTMQEPDYKEVRIAFKVTEPNSSDRVIINTAEISEDSDEDGEPVDDIDSTPDNDKDGEDDIDIEKIVVEEFDLALRKFITKINGVDVAESRKPKISQETINELLSGKTTTLEKTHTKTPLQVNTGDTVTYTIRIYNEGKISGYATEITDYLPDGLKLKEGSQINTKYGWTNPNGDGKTIVTTALSDDLLSGIVDTDIRYIDVQVECEVIAKTGSTQTSLKNVAEITKAEDEKGNEQVKDRDSDENNLTDEQKNNYNPVTSEQGWGYEDDDDYEELVIPSAVGDFELKLIKENGLGNKLSGAIFKVEEINSEGEVIKTYDGLTTNDAGEVVTGRIAVASSGTYYFVITETQAPDGYEILAEPIKLEVQVEIIDGKYTVTNVNATRTETQINQSNLQKQNLNSAEVLATTINLETNNLNINEEAESISIANGAVKSINIEDNNTVVITIENNYFDLALRKFITKINGAPVSTNGNPAMDRTPVITDETKQDLFNRTITTAEKTHTKTPLQVNTGDTVTYTIRVYNEGEVSGYAKEIVDYLPDGLVLKADSQINTQNGWTNPSGDGKTIVTTYTADKLIKGFDGTDLSYVDVEIECEVVAQKGTTETKLKNVAEITKVADEDGNEDVKDRDSEKNNLTDEQKNNYNPGESEKGWGYEDDDDYEELVLPSAMGEFEFKLIKENSLNQKLQGAIFKIEELNSIGSVINTYDDLTTNEVGEVLTGKIGITEEGQRKYRITEKQAPSGYALLTESIEVIVTTTLQNGSYVVTAQIANQDQTVGGTVKNITVDNNTVVITIENNYFDLALRKFITKINGAPVSTNGNPAMDRTPVITDETKQDLFNRTITTAEKTHTKTPLQVNTGDTVTYTIRVYNEGEVSGYAKEIVDYLPDGLVLKADSQINTQNGWTNPSGDGKTIVTTYTADKLIKGFDGTDLSYVDVEIECEVVAQKGTTETKLKNVAEITKVADEDGNEDVKDRDSEKNNLTDEQKNNYNPGESEKGWGYEDDDDYEELVLPSAQGDFKIKLIKENGLGNKLQGAIFKVDEIEESGALIKTYGELTTNDSGEILIDNIEITGEGTRLFEITEIKAPDGYTPIEESIRIEVQISLVDGKYVITAKQVGQNSNSNEDNNRLSKISQENRENVNIAKEETKEIEKLAEDKNKVGENDVINTRISRINITEKKYSASEIISDTTDATEKSKKTNVVNTNDSVKNITINGNTIEITIENNYFDLALRKFITGVNDDKISNRVPVFSIEDGKYVYTHPKDPVEVANGDTVIYTLRIYNEGTQAGYAEEVKDDLPEGLEFLPENSINTEYRWVMYNEAGEVTEDPAEAVSIRTDYLSKAQGEESDRDNLLKGFDSEKMTEPDHRDLKIAFKVTEPNTSDRVIINIAEISDDGNENGEPVDDIDSTPDNDKEGEDDIDIEKIKVSYFDLALRKIVSKVTMKYDGKTYVDETGHRFEDEPEEVVKVELGSKKIKAEIKFTYQIRITNEGNKAGYAYEIKDYIPEGLEFIPEDNEKWKLSEDGKTITTDQLKDTLLKPGDSAIIEVTFKWINGEDNLGIKTNWAEISEDSDDDIDSTPDNFEKGEDDIDKAEVVLSIVTGIGEHYIGVITAVVILFGAGIILIKKFVL